VSGAFGLSAPCQPTRGPQPVIPGGAEGRVGRGGACTAPAPAFFLLSAFFLASCTLLSSGAETPPGDATLPVPQITLIPAPDPEIAASNYLAAWRARQYEAMYEMLSPLSQDGLSREEFVQTYQDVWVEAALSGLDFEIVSSLVNPQAAQVRYRLTFHSAVVGDITRETWMDLKRADGAWKLAWTPAAILPELAEGDGLLLAPVTPTRANIYDRNGLALVAQEDTVALWIIPNQVGDEAAEGAMLNALSRLLDRRPENILALYDDIRPYDWFTPLGEVSLEEFRSVEATLNAVGGVQWRIYPSRYYVGGGLAPQATGYVSWIAEERLEEYLSLGYQGDEFVGQGGLEKTFEAELRGIPGGTLFLTDADGQPIREIASRSPEPPLAVYTTIDRELQRQAQRAIAGFNGAIAVMDLQTGAVLSLVSSPSYDPNLFDPNHPYSQAGLQEFLSDANRPLLNRATSAEYPLGSVFKIITMAAGLESGYYEPDTVYNCGLEFRELPGLVLYDWRYAKGLPASGEITLSEGLERSCNPYFTHIGLDLFNRGLPTALSDMARAFGLGQPTGIEIGDEPGLIPDPQNKLERFGTEWAGGDPVNLAIGQGYLGVTPLQVARFVAAVANGGTLYRPQLVSRVQSAEGQVRFEFQPEVQGHLPISPEHLTAIQDAMFLVTSGADGTARRVLRHPTVFSIKTAGKTGTAESGAADPHAWFAGYTMMGREDKPDIVVVVLAEYQGEGSEWAAPIFRRVVESYFFGRPYTKYEWESQIGVVKTATPTPGPEEATETPTPTPEPEGEATPTPES